MTRLLSMCLVAYRTQYRHRVNVFPYIERTYWGLTISSLPHYPYVLQPTSTYSTSFRIRRTIKLNATTVNQNGFRCLTRSLNRQLDVFFAWFWYSYQVPDEPHAWVLLRMGYEALHSTKRPAELPIRGLSMAWQLFGRSSMAVS